MHWISPRARAGLRMLAASMAPSAAPAPIRVCSSSMKRMMFLSRLSSSMTFFMRSSNSPRYFAPASMPARSSETMRLPRSSSGTLPSAIFWARPSATADLPTPGSPMSTGLFFVRRERIWMMRSISSARPMTGSSSPARAARVRSRPYCIRVGALSSPSFFSPPAARPLSPAAPGFWPRFLRSATGAAIIFS